MTCYFVLCNIYTLCNQSILNWKFNLISIILVIKSIIIIDNNIILNNEKKNRFQVRNWKNI